MALEDIFRALQEQAERDIEETLAEAHAHAAAIMEEARAEASESRVRYLDNAERTARTRSAQSMNAARLETRKQIAGVKEEAVRRAFDEAMAELGKVRDQASYGETFRALLAEALDGVEGEFELLVDPADEALAREALQQMGKTAAIKPEISTAGGVVVSTEGGHVLRRNTLEDRLEKFRGLSQAEVAGVLFA